ncbi:ComEC family competence protein [Candidatus Azambacteria bacterium]|nr:ComEC family competence protein [Candidatus Azambacteria bacterium]
MDFKNTEKLSKSKIFLFLMLSFLGGIFYASIFSFDPFLFLLFSAVSLVFLFSFFGKKSVILFLIFSAIFYFGIFWYQRSVPKDLFLDAFLGQNISLEGVVAGEPEFKDATQKIVVETDDEEKVLITVNRYPEYEYGDRLLAEGKLKKPENFSGFDYKNYLAKDGIYFLMQYPNVEVKEEGKGIALKYHLFKLKNAFEENIKSVLPSPESDFMNGMLFGSKSEMPKTLYDAFIKTGTAHIVALSGFNVTIIVVFLAWMFGFFFSNRKIVALIAIFMIVLFVVMTGASSSVVRAAIMGSVLLMSRYYGRAQYSLNALIFAAFLMSVFNPKILVFDISFQLSFLATCGLLYIYPYLLEKFKKIPDIFKLRDTMSATLAAQAAVLPILVHSFSQISLISPLANILVLPLVPVVMLLGFLAGFSGFIFMPLAHILAVPLWALLAYQVKAIEFLAGVPFASISF